MTEQRLEELDRDEIALSRFKEALSRIRTPNGEFVRNLVDGGLVRLVTDEQTLNNLQRGRKTGGIGFSVHFDGKEKVVKAMVGIDPERFATRGPRSLEALVRDVVEKFGYVIKIAERNNLDWRYLEDSEVEPFLVAVLSGGGKGFRVIDNPNTL